MAAPLEFWSVFYALKGMRPVGGDGYKKRSRGQGRVRPVLGFQSTVFGSRTKRHYMSFPAEIYRTRASLPTHREEIPLWPKNPGR